jgi:hypothetical protein
MIGSSPAGDPAADQTEVRAWDAGRGGPIPPPLKLEGWVPVLLGGNPNQQTAISPDGRHLVTVTAEEKELRLWDLVTGQKLGEYAPKQRTVHPSAFSADGSRLIVREIDAITRKVMDQVLNTATGQAVGPHFEAAEPGLPTSALSPDGGRLLTASGDGTAQVWDAATGEALTPPLRHTSPVWHAQFSADGRRIFTATARSPDTYAVNAAAQEVRVWDAATGQPLTPPLIVNQSLQRTNDEDPRRWFTRDGRRMLLVRTDAGCGMPAQPPGGAAALPQTIAVRDLAADLRPVEDLRAEVEVLSGRRLTPTGNVLPLEENRFREGWQRLSAP